MRIAAGMKSGSTKARTGEAIIPTPMPIEACTVAPTYTASMHATRRRATGRASAVLEALRVSPSPDRSATGASGTARPAPCAPRSTTRPRIRGGPTVTWIGRSAGDSRCSTTGRPPPRGCSRHTEQVLHANRRRRLVTRVVDRHRAAGRQVERGRRELVEVGAQRPGQLRAQHHRQVHPLEVGATGAPGRYGREPFVERSGRASASTSRATARPTDAMEELDPLAQHAALGRSPGCRSRGRPAARDRISAAVVSSPGAGAAVGAAELDGAEPSLDDVDEFVAVVVPHRAIAVRRCRCRTPGSHRRRRPRRRDGSSTGRPVRRGRRRRRTPPRPSGVVVGQPRRPAGPELELAGRRRPATRSG